jgi:hypothetical protein
MRSLRSTLIVGLAAAALLASVATAAQTGAVPSRLAGAYVTRFPSTQSRVPAGRWKLELHSTKATFHNPVSPRAVFTLALDVSGSRVTFGVDNLGCPGKGKGKYQYRLSGKRLTFAKITDRCANRAYVLTTHPWTKVK